MIQNNLRTPQLAGFARQLGCKKLTVKHFCEMGEYNLIFHFSVQYVVLFGMHTHHTKMLDNKLFTSAMQGDCHKLAKDTPNLFLYQALHFSYSSNQDSNFDVHVSHGNPLPHNNHAFCLKLVYL